MNDPGKMEMAQHANRFTGRVADYAQYRERYDSNHVLPFLREQCGLTPDWTVADVGAGTGMLGDVFRSNGNRVIAIEPNAEMRSACAESHASDNRFKVLDGSAERTGLPDSSVEMIAVGRALHWFDVDRALVEFRRVLKPGGWVTIAACGRHEDGREENRAFTKLLRSLMQEDRADRLLEIYLRLETLFPGGEFHHAEVDGEMQMDWESLRGMALSMSPAPMPGTPGFSEFESELRCVFDRYAQDGLLKFATRTWLNAGRFGE